MTITKISGIGTKTAEILANNGFKTVRAIAGSTVEKLSNVPGFGPSRARTTISAAIALLGDTPSRSAKGVSSPKTKAVSKKTARTRTKSKTRASKKVSRDKAKPKTKEDKKAAGTKSSHKEKLRKQELKKEKLRKEKLKKEKLRKQKPRRAKAKARHKQNRK